MRSRFVQALLRRLGLRKYWYEIDGWFTWRSAQEEAVKLFPENSRFVEVGTYLGRSLCSLAEVVTHSGKNITIIGIDTCRGSGPEVGVERITTRTPSRRETERSQARCIRTCWIVDSATR